MRFVLYFTLFTAFVLFLWFSKKHFAKSHLSATNDLMPTQPPTHLPDSDDAMQLHPPSAEQTAQRVLAILAIFDKAHQDKKIVDWVASHQIDKYFSDEEKSFFNHPSPEEKVRIEFSWRVEGLVPLLWALGIIDEMPPLNQMVKLDQYAQALKSIHSSPEAFIESASLRSHQEIEKLEEHLYHQHWRTRDAYLFKKPMPKELDPRIVYERRYAASWLVGWSEDWDEVPTDT
ncbi:MAG: DUF4272 domain-containing protein [Phycisphaeraceae bacterium JB051]